MKILVGLGNPGEDYMTTRHNIGTRVAEEILQRRGQPYEERKARSIVGRVRIGDHAVIVARPQTFMNRSGRAVADLLKLAETGPEDLLVVCDDLYLDLGRMRLRTRGSHGGHNGLLSIIETLETQAFARLRVGVGPADPEVPHADFVLAPFTRREQSLLPDVVRRAADCAEAAIVLGVAAAMNRFNRTPPPGAAEGPL
ncbi:MAG: aminoacyl-tRNA hydrolase [Acidobacteria bacterium 13_1_20CM_2_68_14]|nr:MAG: aminoacyl-tRNA hydrolase [Acidobacteria bacterium 13_1_20CM_2_68_14]